MSETSPLKTSPAGISRSLTVIHRRWVLIALITLAIGYWCFREPAAQAIPGTVAVRDTGIQEGLISLGSGPQLGPFQLQLSAAEFVFLWSGNKYAMPRVNSTRFSGPYVVDQLPDGHALVLIGDEATVLQPDGRSTTLSLLPPSGSTGSAAALDTFLDGRRLTVLLRSKRSNGTQCDLVSYDLPEIDTDESERSASLQPVHVMPVPSDLSTAYFLGDTDNWIGIDRISRNLFDATENVGHLVRADGETLDLPVGFSRLMKLGTETGSDREPLDDSFVAIAERDEGYELALLHTDGPLELDDRGIHINLASGWPPAALSHSRDGRWCVIKAVDYQVKPVVGFARRYRKERLILIDVSRWSIAAQFEFEDASFEQVGKSHFISARFSADSKQVEVAKSNGEIATIDVESWVQSQDSAVPSLRSTHR